MADRSDDDLFARFRATMSHVSAETALFDREALRMLKTDWLYCLLAQVRDDAPEHIGRNVEQAIPIDLSRRCWGGIWARHRPWIKFYERVSRILESWPKRLR